MSVQHYAPLVLITGASQGIGAAIAKCFANADFPVRLALLARTRSGLMDVAAECAKANSVKIYTVDVSDAEQVADFAQTLKSEMGEVDVLINNAGSWLGSSIVDMAVADFDRIVAANLRSTFLLSKMVLPAMIAKGAGDIFNMSSTAGFEGYAGVSAYCAAKHGVSGFTKALREEVRGKGVRVCCVSPGPTHSPSWQDSGVAKEQLMPAEDVARAFLAIYKLDRNVVVEDIVLRPQAGHIVSN
ncbi:NADP-dependent 3-hydroxy acid dehydrogenase YdfG [Zhongshania antarctica]|jgi:NADP-dependent 3-hydroxy acid dehydrogenase YdfG|uniref:NADP-dependent 3-hydroxy acid dehydrogenase YdfG n=1 Tax=Zhongshania antarctica TaxID=641702 RepID=A0A840R2W6_9GAMM|nr:SDR family oxidoreductase [Zhongshania antarctica]MBB5186978.1 NADP-dependent 3-hydroxy acid dehydrogenase YdfG [Zhongshania antarctica]